MNLQQIQKQRIKLYKQYLKKQIQKNSKIRKEENSYQRKKQLVNMNELIDKLNLDDIRRIQQRRSMAIMLKEHNSQLSSLKKSGVYQTDDQLDDLRNNSFVDAINLHDQQRINKLKQIHTNTYLDNEAHQHIKKDIKDRVKQIQKQDEERHLKRLKQMQMQSQKNYEEIKQKHSQNMNLYQMHSQLMQENDQYRKQTEKFTQCQNDIISRLKRNESAQRRRNYWQNQEIIKNQMNQYRQRRSLQKSHILQGNDIDESIFKKLLHGSPNNKKWYGEQLRSQMSEMETRKSEQKLIMKEKYKIKGLFGGQHGKERQAQIRYVDKKLGIASGMNLNRSKSINNEQEYHRLKNETKSYLTNYNKINLSPSDHIHQSLPQPRFQQAQTKRLESTKKHSIQKEKISGMMPNIKTNIQTQPLVLNNFSPKSINGFHNQAVQENRLIEKNEDKMEFNGEKKSQERRLYRSFDLVTNQPRFYG